MFLRVFTFKFENLGFDNLDIAELVMAIEDRLKIKVNDSMLSSESVGELN